MHIGFIEDTPLRGGTQIWVAEATRFLLSHGETVTLLAPADTFVADACREAGARVITYDFDEIAINSESYKKNWLEALEPCDVAITTVHPPRNGFHCVMFAAECIRESGIKTVLLPKTGSIVPWYKREYYLPDPSVNTHVICITNFTRDYLIKEYKIPAEKTSLIYQGTEINRFSSSSTSRTEAVKRYPLPQNAAPIIGVIGAIENRKGHIILLQAVRRLLDAGKLPRIQVMIVGEGPDEKMLRAVVSVYELEQHVAFFPFTTEPNYVYDRIDILAFPSLYKEGLPNVLLEAMSMKTPVIATRLAGIPEVVFDGETGFLTDPGNVEQFADAVEQVWTDPVSCEKMGHRARLLMEENMDKNRQFEDFRQFFRRINN